MSKSNTCLCYTYVRIYKEYVNSVKWPMSVVSPTVTSRDFYLHDYVTLLATWPFFGGEVHMLVVCARSAWC